MAEATGLSSTVLYQKAERHNFKGKVYVLIDSGTASAAVDLAGRLAENGAITLGTETGLILRQPLFKTVFRSWSKLVIPQNRGLIPQHLVPKSLEDKVKGSDSQFEFCLSLITKI